MPSPLSLGRHDSWEGVRAVVAGFGVSGFAAADNLNHIGASVTALDETLTDERAEKAELLEVLGATVRLGPGATQSLPDEVDLLVTSPGWHPTAPLLAQAAARGIPVWGEVELAWRLRDPENAAPWLAVTGTNGKTTTVQMLDSILKAAGLRSVAVGNVGLPIVEAVMDPEPYDVFAVELSSFQLHYASSLSCESAAVLNVAEDHLDWYASMAQYAADKGRIYERVQRACVYNVQDPATERLVREADVIDGARAVGFTLGMPAVGMVGLVEDILADRAFIEQRSTSAAELCTIGELASPAPHFVANALAAAALARSHGVDPVAVRDGLRSFRPDGHRIATVAQSDQVTWVNDSKATNPHAAQSSLQAYDPVVWIAGGLAKGARFDALVEAVRDRLRGVVLLGADRAVIASALSRHAPDVPVIVVDAGETEPRRTTMDRVVAAAADLAQPGDTVLLAPGCASMDMFANYGERGDEFAAAVRRRLARPGEQPGE
ncbi:UDP-N-acetylmuramoylalanine--D-glutamate ligase [metagenome]|uniref:UDP-N-acetylmuramoylalanine--D-glutamate ligase n=1 Tax=metagenome TaxID=256318 RepID=A0A2P2BWA3_9ZZZZ